MPTETSKQHQFAIFVNNAEFITSERTLSGVEIKTLAGVPSDYELFEVHGGNSVPIANTDEVHIHEGAHFRAIPAGTFGATDASSQAR